MGIRESLGNMMGTKSRYRRDIAWFAVAVLLGACGNTASRPAPSPTPAVEPTPDVNPNPPGPWKRTENREPCADFNVTRSPWFGDAHVHTTYSVDAVVFNVLGTPTDAYEFARGGEILLAPYDADGQGTRPLRLRRPLDFTAVTDHSEGFGVYQVCFDPGSSGYESADCRNLREASTSGDPALVQKVFFEILVPVVVNPKPFYPPAVCGVPPTACIEGASPVWQEFQDVAEQFYDRSSSCSFTTFPAYEWTGNPAQLDLFTGANLHRNVVFRNAIVPDLPVTYINEQKPQGLWKALRAACQEGKPGCDWLAIPHNSALSGGYMFKTENADGSPMRQADALERAASEPLVEIYQHKGSAECRTGAGTTDEQCTFELAQRVGIFQSVRNPDLDYPASMFVRDALEIGLQKEQEVGANPFQVGMIGGTDTHNAIPGATVEEDFKGHQGVNDDTDARRLYLGGPKTCPPNNPPGSVSCGRSRVDDSPGGLAVVWAEENSRDAIFSAMRRRETYGTSGNRPLLRFFAGSYSAGICDGPDYAATGYQQGVPMGAEIGPFNAAQSPTFTVLAIKDPGEPSVKMGEVVRPAIPGIALQAVEIVKGWVDAGGATHEKVYTVAGDLQNGASVDPTTCETSGPGSDRLCSTWTDPEFDARQRAFYYARLIENPTCRWSALQCNEQGVDCSRPESVPSELIACCDPTAPRTHQERAWASPIWYRPDGLGAAYGAIRFGEGGLDEIGLEIPIGAGVAHDLATSALTVVLSDEDVIWEATLPAGALAGGTYEAPSGGPGGVRRASFEQTGAGPARLALDTVPLALAHLSRVGHMVDVRVQIGAWTASQTRLWVAEPDVLRTRD